MFFNNVGLPVVIVMPSNQSVELTHTARFNASVSGVKPFTYQWTKYQWKNERFFNS